MTTYSAVSRSNHTMNSLRTFVFVFAACALSPTESVIAQTEPDTEKTKVEETQERLTETVLKTATAIDNFFGTDRYSWEDNKTRLTLRGNADYVDKHGWDFSPEVKLYLALPGLNDRLRLIINEDEEDEASGGPASDEESNLAVRYLAKVTKKYGISFDLGLSTRGDPTLQGFVRANAFRNWDLGDSGWVTRFENRLYWYTKSDWRNDFRWYLERRLGENFLFRSRTRFDYQQDKEKEWYPEQRFTLFQQINQRTALAYEAIAQQIFFDDSVFDPEEFVQPCGTKCTQYQLRLRFRQNVKFPWLFYEVWPIAAWTEQRDYEFTPAIRFRLEVVLGNPPRSARLGEDN